MYGNEVWYNRFALVGGFHACFDASSSGEQLVIFVDFALLGCWLIPWRSASAFLLGESHRAITELLKLAFLNHIVEDRARVTVALGGILVGISLHLDLLELRELLLDAFISEASFFLFFVDLRLGPSPFRSYFEEIGTNALGNCRKQ